MRLDQVIRDPEGFEVVLTEQCWIGHVTKQHPEMVPFRDWVVQTIEAPDAIFRAKRDPRRRIYTRKYAHVPAVGNELTLLVYVGNDDRFVATAHFAAAAFRRLGERLWPSA